MRLMASISRMSGDSTTYGGCETRFSSRGRGATEALSPSEAPERTAGELLWQPKSEARTNKQAAWLPFTITCLLPRTMLAPKLALGPNHPVQLRRPVYPSFSAFPALPVDPNPISLLGTALAA